MILKNDDSECSTWAEEELQYAEWGEGGRGWNANLFCPGLSLGNVRSQVNKAFCALSGMQLKYQSCSTMCVTGGLNTEWKQQKGESRVCVSNRWCNIGHVIVKERFCSQDDELLAVGILVLLGLALATIVLLIYWFDFIWRKHCMR